MTDLIQAIAIGVLAGISMVQSRWLTKQHKRIVDLEMRAEMERRVPRITLSRN